ncbi:hypothetical protein Tco_0147583, partial [Tanacetum coccineum]
ENPHRTLKNKGIINSGYITGKGKIQTGKLDFEDVSFVKELQHFNLFSVSQMCDKMNKVLFTDTECLILSPDFKLPDENQILLKVPRQNNMYSFNLENIVPSGEDESDLDCFELPIWHSYSSTNTSASKLDNKRGGPREEEQVFLDDLARLQIQEKEANEEAEALRKNLEQETENLVTQEGATKTSSTNIFSTVSTTDKASSGTNLVSTASPNNGLSLSEITNSQEDDFEIPPFEG